MGELKLHTRSADEWDRVVMAEVLIPEVPNVFGDYWTEREIMEAAYMFMKKGYIIDVEHQREDVSGLGVYVVESFIAREGDPLFIKGSWVVGMRIEDDEMWNQVLSGELNGFSYEALVKTLAAVLEYDDDNFRSGVTEPDPFDGHRHSFAVWVDDNNRPISGGTDEVNGHSHTITTHTITDTAANHVHRYTILMEVNRNGEEE